MVSNRLHWRIYPSERKRRVKESKSFKQHGAIQIRGSQERGTTRTSTRQSATRQQLADQYRVWLQTRADQIISFSLDCDLTASVKFIVDVVVDMDGLALQTIFLEPSPHVGISLTLQRLCALVQIRKVNRLAESSGSWRNITIRTRSK